MSPFILHRRDKKRISTIKIYMEQGEQNFNSLNERATI